MFLITVAGLCLLAKVTRVEFVKNNTVAWTSRFFIILPWTGIACLDWHRLEVRWIVKQFQRFLFYIRSPLISLVSLHTFAMRVSTADGSLNCRIKRSLRLFLGFTLLGFALSSRALVLGIANLSSPKGLRGEKEGRRWMVCKIKQVRGFSFKFLAKKWSGCLWREREGRC